MSVTRVKTLDQALREAAKRVHRKTQFSVRLKLGERNGRQYLFMSSTAQICFSAGGMLYYLPWYQSDFRDAELIEQLEEALQKAGY